EIRRGVRQSVDRYLAIPIYISDPVLKSWSAPEGIQVLRNDDISDINGFVGWEPVDEMGHNGFGSQRHIFDAECKSALGSDRQMGRDPCRPEIRHRVVVHISRRQTEIRAVIRHIGVDAEKASV